MRKIFSALFLISCIASYGQELQTEIVYDKEFYLAKAKKQKKAYWALTGSGIGLVVVGSILAVHAVDDAVIGTGDYNSSQGTGSEICVYTGLGLIVGSIPLMVYSHKNKKRAASLSLEQQNIRVPIGGNLVSKPAAFLSLKISLGK